MTDWVFYSPSNRVPSVGDLLRAIPTRRNLRLERLVTDGAEKTVEAVRAAEVLVGLHVALRLTNDASGSLRILVDTINEAGRSEYRALERTEPKATSLKIRAEVALLESAMDAGHSDLADDVLAGLERIFPGGVAHSPMTAEVLVAKELASVLDADVRSFSHVDALFECVEPQGSYIAHLLGNLPAALQELIRRGPGTLMVRGRVPVAVSNEELQYTREMLAHCANFAAGGHLRVRCEGVWLDVIERIAPQVAAPPDEWLASQKTTGTITGVFAKLFKKSR